MSLNSKVAVKRPYMSGKSSVLVAKGQAAYQSSLGQFKAIFSGLFLGLQSLSGGFDSLNFCCLIKVTIKTSPVSTNQVSGAGTCKL
jgi:hypothetical protein